MSITEMYQKIKSAFEQSKHYLSNKESKLFIKSDIFIITVMVLLGLSSFGLGKLSSLEKGSGDSQIPNIQKEASVFLATTSPKTNVSPVIKQSDSLPKVSTTNATARVYASKTGKRYYYSWCSSTVKEENKVWFDNPALAEATGLTLALSCLKSQ